MKSPLTGHGGLFVPIKLGGDAKRLEFLTNVEIIHDENLPSIIKFKEDYKSQI